MIKIEFTEEEYKTLLKLTYLGSWMVNSFRTSPVKKYAEVQKKIMKLALEHKMDSEVEVDEKQHPMPTSVVEAELFDLIDEYDDNCLFNLLADKLARRDLEKKHGLKGVDQMDGADYLDLHTARVNKYHKEFHASGVDNLFILKKKTL